MKEIAIMRWQCEKEHLHKTELAAKRCELGHEPPYEPPTGYITTEAACGLLARHGYSASPESVCKRYRDGKITGFRHPNYPNGRVYVLASDLTPDG